MVVVAVTVVSEPPSRADGPLKERVNQTLADASSCVSLGGLFCKSVGCIIDRKRRQIDGEQTLAAFSDFSG